ncbi:exonuclease 1-like [Paramuricea clavata]|uniref:Exonuclease 1-like n=1 Tax=Paramuricea clavata TaxID=317549 RepID=A0A6S7LQ55_PARCT|nr:exonuclease 1-like [Paramuricea clavata]
MGINCLLPFVKKYSTNVNINRFSGQTIAVDASCWIHKSLAISVSQTGTRERFSRIFNSHIQLLKDAGVIPLMVFDGLPLPAKEKENARRQSERRERMEKAQTKNISTTQRNKLASQGQEKTYHDVVECIKLCLCQRVKYVVSPYESDAQIAFLLKNGYADVAVTEDSDLLVYGCEKVIFKLGMNGHGEYFELNNILSGLNTTNTEFVHGCIAAGCDYLSNVRGVGIHRAFSFVKSGKLFEELKKKHSPANYEDLFQMALAVFQHQSVFNPTLLTVQPLNPWTEDPGDEVKHFCGLYPF